MKKMRKLIPALAMLLVSAVMMSTASFAWFSMSTQATATGMQVQAKANAGILITNSAKTTWSSSTTSTQTNKPEKLLPTSTKDASVWYATTSSDPTNANAASETSTYASTAGTASTTTSYLYQAFYVKSASNDVLTNTDIAVQSITIKENEDLALNEAVRVLVKIGEGPAKIYSITGADTQVFKERSSDKNTFEALTVEQAGSGKTDKLGVSQIPNIDAVADGTGTGVTPAVKIEVYIYFDGEDANCKSTNLMGAVDTLTVEITFAAVAA